MKFLNNFKAFESIFVNKRELLDIDIIENIQDILLEIDDEGFISNIWVNAIAPKYKYIKDIYIEISPESKFIEKTDILSEVIKRLAQYILLDRKFYEVRLTVFNNDHSKKILYNGDIIKDDIKNILYDKEFISLDFIKNNPKP